MEASTAALVRPGDLLGGKYRVTRILGKGGMGTVVQAHHEGLKQQVAIKLLLRELALDAQNVERFLREARAAARLQSEHVVRMFDVGKFDGVGPYIVMEYLEGQDLERLLLGRGPLGAAEAVDYVLEAIDAIAEAHAHGIVHRDLKPSNLFLAERADGSKIVKVLDFGISKQLSKSDVNDIKLTADKLSLGTPAFMAPEQLKSARDVDARADIWSLGVVLQELITGQLPFKGDTSRELFANVLTEPPIPLRKQRPDAPEVIERVIRRCLQRDRNARFADVAQMASALAAAGSGRRSAEVLRAIALLDGRVEQRTSSISDLPQSLQPTVHIDRGDPTERQTQRSWGGRAAGGPTRRTVTVAAFLGALVVVAGVSMAVLRTTGKDSPPATPPAEPPPPAAAAFATPAAAEETAVPSPSVSSSSVGLPARPARSPVLPPAPGTRADPTRRRAPADRADAAVMQPPTLLP
jgi:eukaryotic-like serine/threonine-protein kinase